MYSKEKKFKKFYPQKKNKGYAIDFVSDNYSVFI